MRALGVDYGRKRIGLALSDATGLLARPWKTIGRSGNPLQVARMLAGELRDLQQDEPAGVVVIGYPRHLSGEATADTETVQQLADHLRSLVTVPVVLQDERLTSREAEELLARRETDWRRRKAQLDAMAAAVILQDYLDSSKGHEPGTEDSRT